MSTAFARPSGRMSRLAVLSCCTALYLLPFGAAAQEVQDDTDTRLSPVLRLPEITITASGVGSDDDANSVVAHELWVGGKVATSILDTPASVSVVTQKEIERRNATTLEEVLQYSAGTVTDYYGTDDRNEYFLIRGFEASTYRDGLTLGSMRAVREEPLAYERVEIIRGANSTLFGIADPGGSVNFVTKRPRAERFSEVFATVGSFDQKIVGFDFGDTLDPDATLSYRFTGKLQDSEREYDYSKDDEEFLMGGLTWAPSDATSLTIIADYLKRDATPNSGGYPRGGDYDRELFLGEPDFNYLNVERSSLSAIFEHDFGGGLTLRSNLRYSDTADDYGYVYTSGDAGTGPVPRGYLTSDNEAHEIIGNAMLQYDRSFARFDSSTLVGIEYSDSTSYNSSFYGVDAGAIDPDDPEYVGPPSDLIQYEDQRRDTRNKAIFVQQNLSFDDRVIATVGARHDWLDLSVDNYLAGTSGSDEFSETSVRGALTYKVTDEISTYVSYAESVAPPAIGLEPERGEQYEIGVKYDPTGMNALFSAAIYDLSKTNITVVDPDTLERELVGEIRVRGLDLEAKAEVMENVALTASYSYTDTEIVRSDPVFGVDVEGNAVGSVPNHAASLWLDYTLPGTADRGEMTFGLGARYVGSYFFVTQNNNGRSEATTLLDAAFSYDVTDSTELALNISNLLDEQHVVGRGTADYYNPGRAVYATLRHRW